MRRIMLSAAVVAIGMACLPSAKAADVLNPVYKAPPRAIAFSWTGCYFGGNAGGIWADKNWFTAAGAALSNNSPSGFLGGVQVGCNYQTGAWVIGVQGDYDWSDASGTGPEIAGIDTMKSRISGLGSATGRIGYAMDRILGYVKGGGAWARDDYDILTPAGAVLASGKETRFGWTGGFGAEYAFTPNLSSFVEFDYYDFGRRTVGFFSPAGVFVANNDIRQRAGVVKGGINWRFGGGL